jgi:hypothetical protein
MKTMFVPETGQRVRVRRWEVPCPEIPAGPQRKLVVELTGIVASVDDGTRSRPMHEPVIHFDPASLDVSVDTFEMDPGDHAMIALGHQFCGQEPDHGYSWTLQTEIEPALVVFRAIARRGSEVVARLSYAGKVITVRSLDDRTLGRLIPVGYLQGSLENLDSYDAWTARHPTVTTPSDTRLARGMPVVKAVEFLLDR